MSITIEKPISKKYLIDNLRLYEEYILWDKLNRTVIDSDEYYIPASSTDISAIEIVDAEMLEKVQKTLPSANLNDWVIYVPAITHDEQYWRHKYRALTDTYEFVPSFDYSIGTLCVYEDKLWKATKNTKSDVFNSDDWIMVGAASIFNVVSALPEISTLDEDQAFILKKDEIDNTDSENPILIHRKGLWIYDNENKSYYQFDEHEEINLDFIEVFDDSKSATYKGNKDKIVNSKFLYEQISNVAGSLNNRINELFDISKDAEYIILEDEIALKSFDLSTLKENTMNIFLVKEDHDHLIDPDDENSDPLATLYGCVAVEDVTERKLDYIGQLSMSNIALEKAVQELIDKNIKLEISGHYEKVESSDVGSLLIVNDGTKTNEIEISNVTPIVEGNVITIGSSVGTIDAYQISLGGKEVVADGTLINEIEENEIIYTINNYVSNIGDKVDAINAYTVDNVNGAYEVVADGTAVLQTEIEESNVTPLIDGSSPVLIGSKVNIVTAYDNGTTYEVVANGTKANQIELSSVTPIIENNIINIGSFVDKTSAYQIVLGGKEVVDDGTLELQIEISEVNPVSPPTYIPTVGDYVKFVGSELSDEYKFMEKKDYDTETLMKVSKKTITYIDEDGIDSDIDVTYLTYDNTELMPREFEDNNISFESDEYQTIIPNTTV